MSWAPDYVAVADLRSFLRIPDQDDDAELALAIATASRAVDLHCNRQFGRVEQAEQRHYPARWSHLTDCLVLAIDDLMTTDDLVVGDQITSWRLEPVNAAATGRPWTRLVVLASAGLATGDLVPVTARWGWSSVPEPVKQATLLQASRLFNRRTSPYGIAGSPEQGSELRLLARLDPDVSVSLGPYIRWWGGA